MTRPGSRRRRRPARARPGPSSCSSIHPRPIVCSTFDVAARGGSASGSRATRRPASRWSRRRSMSWRRETARCSRTSSAASPTRTPRRRHRVGVDFEDLQLTARDLLRDHAAIRARELALPVGPRRRVPGHEPPAVRADRSAGDRGSLLRRRRVPVDLPLPARRRRGLPRAPRGLGRGACAHGELLLAARGAAGHQPPVLVRLRRLVPAPLAAGRFEDPAFGPAVELLVTDKSTYKDRAPIGARRRRSIWRTSEGPRRFGRGDSR